MSQPQPQKGNFMSTLLMMAVLFLGYQLFFGQRDSTPDARKPAEIVAEMRKLNREVKDISIVKVASQLENKINEAKLPAAQADALRAESIVLVADAQYKAGIQRKDFNRMNLAFMTIESKKHQLKDSKQWEVPVDVNHTTQFARSQISPSNLYNAVNQAMTDLGKQTLVWGIVPGFQLIDYLVTLTGSSPGFSYGFAALLLALVVRAIIWPLAQKQYMWSRQMSQLQPLVAELKKKYTNPQEVNVKVMELYREYGINPMSGCLPALIQMPLFLIVYQCMLHYRYEFQKGTFFWIHPDSTLGPFFAHNLGEKDNLLIIFYGVSMLATTLITPVSDPANAKQQRLIGVAMSVIFTAFMFTGVFPVPAAFVLYWIFTNMLATGQSLRAYRLALPPLVKVNAPGGGVFPAGGTSANGTLNGATKSTGAPKLHKPRKKKKK